MRKTYPRESAATPGLSSQPQGQLDPEQQKQLQLFITTGKSRLADPLVKRKISEQLDVQDPFDAIASATVGLIDMIVEKLVSEGAKIDPSVLLGGCVALMTDIIALYEEKTGDTLDEEERSQALAATVSQWLDNAIRTGQITKEELAQLSEMMQQTEEGKKIAAQVQQGQGVQQESQSPPAQQIQQPGLAQTGLLGG